MTISSERTKGIALPPEPPFSVVPAFGRRTSGVGDQAMGGLTASAAGALSN
jgi:hypothetical protein